MTILVNYALVFILLVIRSDFIIKQFSTPQLFSFSDCAIIMCVCGVGVGELGWGGDETRC